MENVQPSSPLVRVQLAMIAAHSDNYAIGFKGEIPWSVPEDMKHFREITLYNPLIVGRKTYESLPAMGLAKRAMVVVTSEPYKLVHDDTKEFKPDSICSTIPMAIEDVSGTVQYLLDQIWAAKGKESDFDAGQRFELGKLQNYLGRHFQNTPEAENTIQRIYNYLVELDRLSQPVPVTVFLAGGQRLYEYGAEHATVAYITRIKGTFDGDAFFPMLGQRWDTVQGGLTQKSEGASGLEYTFQTWYANKEETSNGSETA